MGTEYNKDCHFKLTNKSAQHSQIKERFKENI